MYNVCTLNFPYTLFVRPIVFPAVYIFCPIEKGKHLFPLPTCVSPTPFSNPFPGDLKALIILELSSHPPPLFPGLLIRWIQQLNQVIKIDRVMGCVASFLI